jgi:FtsP/CotA-like multicopper oxidase with cupredoxin domain
MLSRLLTTGVIAAVGSRGAEPGLFAGDKGISLLPKLTGNPLRFPPVITGGTMTLAAGSVSIWPGSTTQVFAINNSYPAPTVQVERGSTFTVKFINQLSEPSTIHWHGLIVPELMDGHPKDAVQPGASYTYSFPVLQRAGTYLYHSHAFMRTAAQVYKGFAGFFIVTDASESTLGLPTGGFDVSLVIQDRRSVDVPQFAYNPTPMDVMSGFLGDLPLVNGTPDAYLEVSRTLYRFRLLNGSNARVYKVGLSDNHLFHILATDGGLKDQAVEATSFMLSPGERVEILMDFSSYAIGQSVILKSLPFTQGIGQYPQGVEMNLLRFDVTGNAKSGGIVPASLPPLTYHDASNVVRTRTFALTSAMMGGHKINNVSFDLKRIDEEVPTHQLEEWVIVNETDEHHPMHIHGLLFQVHSRNGNTILPASEKGWKDTVLVNPRDTVKVLVRFDDYAGVYLFHCHNLEHEDDGMMLNIRVITSTDIADRVDNLPSEFTLQQNYPNPFNPSTRIRYGLPIRAHVLLTVFSALGQKVSVLRDGEQEAGYHEVRFDGANLPSGVYFCRIQAGVFTDTKELLLIR